MDLAAAGLNEQPFRTHGHPLAVIDYGSQKQALRALKATWEAPHGLCLLQGPNLAGKSTLIRGFVDSLPIEYSFAVVDGKGLNTTSLLESILRQFGYVLDHSSTNELMGMLRVFAAQQAGSGTPPILIIENTHALNPSALRVLCELSELTSGWASAIKLVLASDRPIRNLLDDPALESLKKRVSADFHMHPMTNIEAMDYLHTKLRAAGSDVPEYVFPVAVCTELWRASGGWPGILDRLALLAIARSESLPISVDQVEKPALPKGTWAEFDAAAREEKAGLPPGPPTLYVSLDGETLHEMTLDKARLLIGRSEHNDVPLGSRFISRHHALLVRHGSTTFLMDLNSTNGTYVNSRRVSNHVLIDDDIITLGQHRIKFKDPHATRRGTLEGVEFADTAIMKTLEDMRNLLARENTEILPAPSENVPTTKY
ncbi:MAG: FHA domain-containing protein [Gammaproteobacteria bacterium]|nr:FHA domain-containing protein [Gammaproteobacteria bacterium]